LLGFNGLILKLKNRGNTLRLTLKKIFNILLGVAVLSLLALSGTALLFNNRLIKNQRYFIDIDQISNARNNLNSALSEFLVRETYILMARDSATIDQQGNQETIKNKFVRGLNDLAQIAQIYPMLTKGLTTIQSLHLEFIKNDQRLFMTARSIIDTRKQLQTLAAKIGHEIEITRDSAENVNGMLVLLNAQAERQVKDFLTPTSSLTEPVTRAKFKIAVASLVLGNGEARALSSRLNTDFADLTALVNKVISESNSDGLTNLRINQAPQLIQLIRSELARLNLKLQTTPDLLLVTEGINTNFNKVVAELNESPVNLFKMRESLNDKQVAMQQILNRVQKNVNFLNAGFLGLETVTAQLQSELLAKAKHISAQSRSIMFTIVVLVLLLIGIIGNYLRGIIAQALRLLTATMKKIAGEKSGLDTRLEKTKFEDLNEVSEAFNTMTSRLQFIHEHLEELIVTKTKELDIANQKLLSSARQAGMAEVATSILHNVGNILNSVKVSVGILNERMVKPDFKKLVKIIEMIKANKNNLSQYLLEDTKGKLLPEYLITLVNALDDENANTQGELKSLQENLKHIEDIVAMQQTISGSSSGVLENLFLPDVIDTACSMCSSSLENKAIKLQIEFIDKPFLITDKSKLIQILVNLIQNAKDALMPKEYVIPAKKIFIQVKNQSSGDAVDIIISDNGIGILQENLIKIFSQGFTTKQTGHGFGLHSSANAARQMGGNLQVNSKGNRQGSTFILTLPLKKIHKEQVSLAQN
jgi:signal transduction histidine kinase